MPAAAPQVEILLGTGEVARLCGVSQATIKRWADDGTLHCVRTPGGHRRFQASELRHFLGARGYAIPAGLAAAGTADPDPEGVALYALNDEFERVVDRLVERVRRPGLAGPDPLLSTLLTVGLPLEKMLDRVVVPALRRLRSLRELGQISLVGLQAAVHPLEEALARLPSWLPRGIHRGRLALVAGLVAEPSTLPVRLSALVLESDGWTVAVARHGAPATGLVDYLGRSRCDLLCLPVEGLADAGVAAEQLGLIHGACRELGTSMILIGEAATRLAPPAEADHVVKDLTALLEVSREI